MDFTESLEKEEGEENHFLDTVHDKGDVTVRTQYSGDTRVLPSCSGSSMRLGVATSQDGVHWERYAGNPVFEPSDIKGDGQFWFTNAVLKDDVYYLFVEGAIGQATQIYLATHQGSITPKRSALFSQIMK